MNWPNLKTYWLAVAGLLVIELASWLAYSSPQLETVVTLAILGAAVAVAWKRPTWLVYATMAELVVGGKGYLFFIHLGSFTVTLRMILFTVTFLTTLPSILRSWSEVRRSVLPTSLLALAGWLVLSVATGVFRHNAPSVVYTDANAFLYLGVLPAWWLILRRDQQWQPRVLTLLLAGATVIGLESWLMVLLFGQNITSIHQVYSWIRNTGVGEITYINSNLYRVFFQSQIYTLLVFCLLLFAWVRQQFPKWLVWPMAAASLGLYISLSRSFWLGLAGSLVLLISWLMFQRQWLAMRRLLIILPLGFFAWAMMIWALSFPAWHLDSGRASSVLTRLNNGGASAAATARINQIKPLVAAIGHHPVWGSGFGTTVTYYSTDPTVHGWRSTTAFELGYLDLWLKIGLVGIALYAWWVWQIGRRVVKSRWGWPLMAAGLALLVTNLTSPYLNHPLGLGWLMLISLFAADHE